MFTRKLTVFVLVIGLLCSSVFAQTATPAEVAAEKAKKAKELEEQIVVMLDRTIADIGGLKLPGNRAVVYSLAGDIYWRYDPKRSRELFRNVANELIVFQAEAEKEKLENVGSGIPEMFDTTDPRFEVLNLIGNRDPELGLELMNQTRPPAIADAMARISQQTAIAGGSGIGAGSGVGIGAGSGPAVTFDADRVRATQEISLEQQLTMRAAMNDPEKAAKAIKDMLAKGVSYNVIPLLQQVMAKDEKRATDLGSDVIGKITSTDFTRSNDDLNGVLSILQFMTRAAPPPNPSVKYKVFAFSAAQAKESAYQVASAFLQPSPPAFVNNSLGRALPLIEKLAPEKVLSLKQKDAQIKKAAGAAAPKPASGQQARPWNPNDTPEVIIAAAAKIANARDKMSAYQAAAGKIGQIPDEARAKRIIESIPDERIRAQAQNTFDANRINRMTVEGRLDEAKASVAALTNRRSQIQRLVALAMQFQRKNTAKDTETAGGLMAEARSYTNQYPEDEDELADYMELVRGYALVEPDVAFRMIEPFMEQFNDMVQASATLSRYNKRDRTFKKGEMVMRVNGGGSNMLAFRYVQQMQLLAAADLDRMNTLSDRFQRSDARTLLKLQILQGYQRAAPVSFAPFVPR